MEEKDDYEVKAVEEEGDDSVDFQKAQKEIPPSQSPKPAARRSFPIPKIPADKIFKTITNKEKMMETLHDETLEPHVHLVIILLIVFVLAIIIALIGI